MSTNKQLREEWLASLKIGDEPEQLTRMLRITKAMKT